MYIFFIDIVSAKFSCPRINRKCREVVLYTLTFWNTYKKTFEMLSCWLYIVSPCFFTGGSIYYSCASVCLQVVTHHIFALISHNSLKCFLIWIEECYICEYSSLLLILLLHMLLADIYELLLFFYKLLFYWTFI